MKYARIFSITVACLLAATGQKGSANEQRTDRLTSVSYNGSLSPFLIFLYSEMFNTPDKPLQKVLKRDEKRTLFVTIDQENDITTIVMNPTFDLRLGNYRRYYDHTIRPHLLNNRGRGNNRACGKRGIDRRTYERD